MFPFSVINHVPEFESNTEDDLEDDFEHVSVGLGGDVVPIQQDAETSNASSRGSQNGNNECLRDASNSACRAQQIDHIWTSDTQDSVLVESEDTNSVEIIHVDIKSQVLYSKKIYMKSTNPI